MPEKLVELAGAAEGPVAAADGWHELAVANPTFLLERLGSECTDLQGLRELTVNGLDAIAALGAERPGRVVWDLDWERFEASGGCVRKLSVIDTGTGMTAEQLRHYINQLAASGREQSSRGNLGVGAKVAAGSRNPHGLEYRSWQEGHGSLVCFKRHPDGRWGLEPQRWADGHVDYWRPLGEAEKPWLLRGQDHGTQVVLLGQHGRHDTTQAPQTVTDADGIGSRATSTAASFAFPRTSRSSCANTTAATTQTLRRIHGEQHHLEHHAVAAGTVELGDAIVRWWVLDDDHRARRREAVLWASTGHAAAVFGDELYDVLPPTAAGTDACRTSAFASAASEWFFTSSPRTGPPVSSATPRGRCCCSTTSHCRGRAGARNSPPRCRTRSCGSRNLPPGPTACRAERRSAAASARSCRCTDSAATAQPERKAHGTASRPPLVRPTSRPAQPAPRASGSPRTEPAVHPAWRIRFSGSPTTASRATRRPRTTPTTTRFRPPIVDLPDVAWISARDATRAPGDLEDQAARYHPARHELTINADFRAITDLLAHWRGRYRGVPGADAMIEAQVREWCEQILVEVVLAARNSHWSAEQLDALLSPSSFTAALLPRQLLHATLQRRLGQKLGPARSDHAESID